MDRKEREGGGPADGRREASGWCRRHTVVRWAAEVLLGGASRCGAGGRGEMGRRRWRCGVYAGREFVSEAARGPANAARDGRGEMGRGAGGRGDCATPAPRSGEMDGALSAARIEISRTPVRFLPLIRSYIRINSNLI